MLRFRTTEEESSWRNRSSNMSSSNTWLAPCLPTWCSNINNSIIGLRFIRRKRININRFNRRRIYGFWKVCGYSHSFNKLFFVTIYFLNCSISQRRSFRSVREEFCTYNCSTTEWHTAWVKFFRTYYGARGENKCLLCYWYSSEASRMDWLASWLR